MSANVATPQQQATPPPPPRTPATARFSPGPQGPFQGPMDLHLQGHQFHRLQEAPLQELLLGPLVLLHKVLPDLGLLHRQVLHQPDSVLVAELELLVVPLLYPITLLDPSLDLQGGPQEACSLTPEDSLAPFPVQGSIFPITCWLQPALLLDPLSLLLLSSLVVCQSRFVHLQTRQQLSRDSIGSLTRPSART